MFVVAGLLASVVLSLMLLKVVRTIQEVRASRAGFVTFGGDDRYQARNVRENVHDAVMVARVRLEMDDAAFDQVIARVQANYLRWYAQLEARIEHKPLGRPFGPPLEIRDDEQEPTLDDTPLLSRIVICRKDKVILLLGNHVYLGGYLLSQFVQLIFCKEVCRQVFPRNRYVPVLSELMMLAMFGHFALRPRHVKSRTHADKALIGRYYLKQPLARIEAEAAALGLHSMYLVMATQVLLVMRRMRKERLRVTLPVSFEDETSFNTVGGLFLDIDAAPDVATLARRMKRLVQRSQWQVAASNHIQRVFPTRRLSEGARNRVDLTLTVVPQKTLPHNLLSKELATWEFTMDNIQYPVYAMSFIFEGHVHTSFMVNSPDFDVAAFEAEDRAQRVALLSGTSARHRDA